MPTPDRTLSALTRELADARRNLTDFARAHGHELAAIYVERIETAPLAFQQMVAELIEFQSPAFVVPGLHHLAVLGDPLEVRRQLERHGTKVLVARHAS